MCAIFAFVLTKHYPGGIITNQSTLNTTPEISKLILEELSNASSLRPQDDNELLDRYNVMQLHILYKCFYKIAPLAKVIF